MRCEPKRPHQLTMPTPPRWTIARWIWSWTMRRTTTHSTTSNNNSNSTNSNLRGEPQTCHILSDLAHSTNNTSSHVMEGLTTHFRYPTEIQNWKLKFRWRAKCNTGSHHWSPLKVMKVGFQDHGDSFISRPLGYERVYLPLYKVADTPFHIPGDAVN